MNRWHWLSFSCALVGMLGYWVLSRGDGKNHGQGNWYQESRIPQRQRSSIELGIHTNEKPPLNRSVTWTNPYSFLVSSIRATSSCGCMVLMAEKDVQIESGGSFDFSIGSQSGSNFGLIEATVLLTGYIQDKKRVLAEYDLNYWRLPKGGVLLPQSVHVRRNQNGSGYIGEFEIIGNDHDIENTQFSIGANVVAHTHEELVFSNVGIESKLLRRSYFFNISAIPPTNKRFLSVVLSGINQRIGIVADLDDLPVRISPESPLLIFRQGKQLVEEKISVNADRYFRVKLESESPSIKISVDYSTAKPSEDNCSAIVSVIVDRKLFESSANGSSHIAKEYLLILDQSGNIMHRLDLNLLLIGK